MSTKPEHFKATQQQRAISSQNCVYSNMAPVYSLRCLNLYDTQCKHAELRSNFFFFTPADRVLRELAKAYRDALLWDSRNPSQADPSTFQSNEIQILTRVPKLTQSSEQDCESKSGFRKIQIADKFESCFLSNPAFLFIKECSAGLLIGYTKHYSNMDKHP